MAIAELHLSNTPGPVNLKKLENLEETIWQDSFRYLDIKYTLVYHGHGDVFLLPESANSAQSYVFRHVLLLSELGYLLKLLLLPWQCVLPLSADKINGPMPLIRPIQLVMTHRYT